MDFLNLSSVLEATTSRSKHELAKVMFSWYDYALFSFMLIVSALIGVYFGCFGKKQSNKDEYLMGGKIMKPFPIAMSQVASNISGIALMGVPADIYRFGINYWMSMFAIITPSLLTSYVYLPVFYELQLTSTYEYLMLRFNSKVRVFASLLYGIAVILFLPIVIYVPALALAQATNINIHFITPLVCGVCIFYTTIGGLKAVVWTDMLQFSVTIIAMVIILYLGVIEAGGIFSVFQRSYEGELLNIDFDWNPTKRDSFWALMIGWAMSNLAYLGTSQSCVQKFLSVPTLKDARLSILYFIGGIIIVKSCCVFLGLIIYAKYYDCDPITTGSVSKPDQLLPYYVMDVTGKIPGLPGLFIAGVFCAALSTLSATMNCVAGTLYEDFQARFFPKDISQEKVSNIMKLNVVVIGVISTSLVFLVEHLGAILPLGIAFSSVTSGPLLGLFTLGILFPQANSNGAIAGAIASLTFNSVTVFGSHYYKAKGLIQYIPKPASTAGCDYDFTPINSTIYHDPSNEEEIFYLFRITYYYYTLMSAFTTIAVGLIVSYLTRKEDDKPVDRKLLSPVVHRFLKREDETVDYYTIERALNIMVQGEKLGKSTEQTKN